jgi:hypothetical protein
LLTAFVQRRIYLAHHFDVENVDGRARQRNTCDSILYCEPDVLVVIGHGFIVNSYSVVAHCFCPGAVAAAT